MQKERGKLKNKLFSRHTHRREGHVTKGKNWSNVAASQGTPRTTNHHQKLGRGEGGFFPRASRRSRALLTLPANAQPPTTVEEYTPAALCCRLGGICYSSPRKLARARRKIKVNHTQSSAQPQCGDEKASISRQVSHCGLSGKAGLGLGLT